MDSLMRIAMVVICLVFLIMVVRQVQKGKLLLKYSLLWITLGLVAIIASIFPGPLYRLSFFLGFENPSNFIFIVGLFFLLAICLSLSIIVSKQASRAKTLVQELAILEKRIETLEKACEDEQDASTSKPGQRQ